MEDQYLLVPCYKILHEKRVVGNMRWENARLLKHVRSKRQAISIQDLDTFVWDQFSPFPNHRNYMTYDI